MEQVIFDLDLDFFLDRTSSEAVNTLRPEDDEYETWGDDEVDEFLRNRLGLNEKHRPLGFRCETHDEVLYACLRLCEKGILQKPFRLLHVDAHDDLYSHCDAVDEATAYHRDGVCPSAKELECEKKVTEANYVCFLLALGMLSEYNYVHLEDSELPHPALLDSTGSFISIKVLDDRFSLYGEEYVEPRDDIWRKIFPNEIPYTLKTVDQDCLIDNPVKALYHHYAKDDHFEKMKPAFLFVSRSPKYTPPKADCLISEHIAPLVDFEQGEKLLEELGQKSKFRRSPSSPC